MDKETEGIAGDCCPIDDHKHKKDWIFIFSLGVLLLSVGAHLFLSALYTSPILLHHFVHSILQILSQMWWGIALGIVIVGLMGKVPKHFFTGIMGYGNQFSGLLRAVLGGVVLDLCCHGILLVAAKLYERGISFPQVVTFLVASPWNSVSLTLILVGLIGLKWTLIYILGSVVIALVTGLVLQALIKAGKLPDNPNVLEIDENFNLKAETAILLKNVELSKQGTLEILKSGWDDGKVIIKWILFGTIIAASMRTFISPDVFAAWLGPSLAGLFVTLFIATIIEICSEGSAPVAAEIVTNAHAPGNGFTFLMAGVATDYTELMALREITKSWAMALALPMITVPQVLLLGWIMNLAVG